MQFFSVSPTPSRHARLPHDLPPQPQRTAGGGDGNDSRDDRDGGAPRRGCGWFDSSFDLSQGLEITEQDHDTLYQLWKLAAQ